MKYQVKMTDLRLSQLNGACLVLFTKFARTLKAHNGQALPLSGDDVIQKLIECAHRTDNQELKELYTQIKLEIKKYVNSPVFSEQRDHLRFYENNESKPEP